MTNTVKVELIEARALTRYPCDLGGSTDKEAILCEVTEGPHAGFRVSPLYLRNHTDVDADLEEKAVAAEKRSAEALEYAAELRSLKGRLVLPSYEEYEAARIKNCIRFISEEIAAKRTWLAELEQLRSEGCDTGDDISKAESEISDMTWALSNLEGHPVADSRLAA